MHLSTRTDPKTCQLVWGQFLRKSTDRWVLRSPSAQELPLVSFQEELQNRKLYVRPLPWVCRSTNRAASRRISKLIVGQPPAEGRQTCESQEDAMSFNCLGSNNFHTVTSRVHIASKSNDKIHTRRTHIDTGSFAFGFQYSFHFGPRLGGLESSLQSIKRKTLTNRGEKKCFFVRPVNV